MSYRAYNVYKLGRSFPYGKIERDISTIRGQLHDFSNKSEIAELFDRYIDTYPDNDEGVPLSESGLFAYLHSDKYADRFKVSEEREYANAGAIIHYSPLTNNYYIRFVGLPRELQEQLEEQVKEGRYCFTEEYEFYDSVDDLIIKIGNRAFNKRRKTWNSISKYERENNPPAVFNFFGEYDKRALSSRQLQEIIEENNDLYVEILKRVVGNPERIIRRNTLNFFVAALNKINNDYTSYLMTLYLTIMRGENDHDLIQANKELFIAAQEKAKQAAPFVVDVSAF